MRSFLYSILYSIQSFLYSCGILYIYKSYLCIMKVLSLYLWSSCMPLMGGLHITCEYSGPFQTIRAILLMSTKDLFSLFPGPLKHGLFLCRDAYHNHTFRGRMFYIHARTLWFLPSKLLTKKCLYKWHGLFKQCFLIWAFITFVFAVCQ